MADLEPTPERISLLESADSMELWQEDDQRTTNLYLPDFGLSDPVCDMTVQVEAAYEDGLIELVVGRHGGRWWTPTRLGSRMLAHAENDRESKR
jgi:hypothetical protein